jgi:hypothetical protein
MESYGREDEGVGTIKNEERMGRGNSRTEKQVSAFSNEDGSQQ